MTELHVMAGVLVGADGRVLIAQRPPGKHLAGEWEFPGGKLHAGEASAAGLARELREELGVEVRQARPLIQVRHRYPDRKVLLDVWLVESFAGEPRSLDGQVLRWCPRPDLPTAQLLPADRPVVTALLLPAVIDALGGDGFRCCSLDELRQTRLRQMQDDEAPLLGVACEDRTAAKMATAAGADFVALTAVLPPARIRKVCAELNVPVFVAGHDLQTAWRAGAVGVYR